MTDRTYDKLATANLIVTLATAFVPNTVGIWRDAATMLAVICCATICFLYLFRSPSAKATLPTLRPRLISHEEVEAQFNESLSRKIPNSGLNDPSIWEKVHKFYLSWETISLVEKGKNGKQP